MDRISILMFLLLADIEECSDTSTMWDIAHKNNFTSDEYCAVLDFMVDIEMIRIDNEYGCFTVTQVYV